MKKMTVRELIEKLKCFPPDMVVHCQTVLQCKDTEYTQLYDIENIEYCKFVTCSLLIEEEKENYVGIFIQ